MLAATEAGLVATGDEDVPVLRIGGRFQDGLPVVEGHGGDALFGDLLGQLHHGFSRHSSGNHGLGLVEPPLNTVGKGNLLLRQGNGREEGDKR